jgi:hypothetical protein
MVTIGVATDSLIPAATIGSGAIAIDNITDLEDVGAMAPTRGR